MSFHFSLFSHLVLYSLGYLRCESDSIAPLLRVYDLLLPLNQPPDLYFISTTHKTFNVLGSAYNSYTVITNTPSSFPPVCHWEAPASLVQCIIVQCLWFPMGRDVLMFPHFPMLGTCLSSWLPCLSNDDFIILKQLKSQLLYKSLPNDPLILIWVKCPSYTF